MISNSSNSLANGTFARNQYGFEITISFIGNHFSTKLLIAVFTSTFETSFSGSTGEKRIKKLPHIQSSLQTLLVNNFLTILLFMSFAIALSTISLNLLQFLSLQ